MTAGKAAAGNKAPAAKKPAKAVKRPPTKNAAPTKKLGLQSSATRNALIDATEALIREQGFATITSRLVASKAGLKPQLIHYYFNSIDDLYVEVFRRGADADLERLNAALDSEQPLRNMWKLSSDPKATRFVTEFMAIANHVEAVRSEITHYAKKRRELQIEAVTRHVARLEVKPEAPPIALAVIMENVARGMVLESALNLSLGHKETKAFVEACLKVFGVDEEVPVKKRGRSRSASLDKPAPKAAVRLET